MQMLALAAILIGVGQALLSSAQDSVYQAGATLEQYAWDYCRQVVGEKLPQGNIPPQQVFNQSINYPYGTAEVKKNGSCLCN
ncbi:MAG: hypothetical protein FIA91_01225 [Geobacter sp.]|nr:hypothetical protein [Geobacter sp.]